MKPFIALFPVLFLAACATNSAPTAEENFKRADKDGTGSVSRVEATNLIISEAFKMFDTNGDGVVSEAEYVANGGTAENFGKVDTSDSGEISLAEAQASPLIFDTFVVAFDEADANKDGQVTLAEYESYLALRDAAVR